MLRSNNKTPAKRKRCQRVWMLWIKDANFDVFHSKKHSMISVCSQQTCLRRIPLGREETECFAVASGSVAWPVANPSGSQTRRSPAG